MSDLPVWSGLTAEEKDAIIRPLWSNGQSASQIAAEFIGATRNAVIGRIARGKMPARKNPGAKTKSERRKSLLGMREALGERQKELKLKTAPKKPVRLPMASPAFVSYVPEPEPVRAGAYNPVTDLRPPLPGVAPISILDLPMRTGTLCRFPVQGGYCGGASGDNVYCEAHSAFALNRDHKNGSLARKR